MSKYYIIYRVLYGETWIQESIKSIDPLAEKIFIFYDDTPWGNVTEVQYKGQTMVFPKKFDNIIEKIEELDNEKVELIYDHMENNVGQFTHLVNDLILPHYEKPDYIMFMEPDHVWRRDQLEKTVNIFEYTKHINATTKPIELWKTPLFRIPERRRLCSILWNMSNLESIPETGRHAENGQMLKYLDTYTHNLGFCYSYNTMYWKHLTSLAFSRKIGDDVPNENWLQKWENWPADNQNLEISAGYESNISHAYPYDPNELPEVIKEKLNASKP